MGMPAFLEILSLDFEVLKHGAWSVLLEAIFYETLDFFEASADRNYKNITQSGDCF